MSNRILAAALVLLPLVGCTKSSSESKSNVAVVDLDVVATNLGLSEQWQAALTQQQSQLQNQLANYQQSLSAEFHSAQEALEEQPPQSEPPQVQLAAYQQQLNSKLQQAKSQAKAQLAQQRNQFIQTFRRQAEHVATQIAQQRGYDVVLTRNSAVVLAVSPSADLTAPVSAAMQHALASSATATAAAPR